MSLEEILAEIKVVKAKLLRSIPGSEVHSDLIVALYVLQDMALNEYAKVA